MVAKSLSLPAAITTVRQRPDESVLIAIGYKTSEIYQQLSEIELHGLEIIVRPPRPNPPLELDELPSSSLLDDGFMINAQNTIPALRKSLLRIRLKKAVSVRPLKSKEDFRQYFRLRYKVWKEMGYLPASRDCPEGQMELDFTDRTALPISAFTPEGALIRYARLAFPSDHEVRYGSLIKDLVVEQGSAVLLKT